METAATRQAPWSYPTILGEAMETSASFEARSAPLPYPTVEINRPNCLIVERLRQIWVQADLDRLILTIRQNDRSSPVSLCLTGSDFGRRFAPEMGRSGQPLLC